jgi:putative membrane protein
MHQSLIVAVMATALSATPAFAQTPATGATKPADQTHGATTSGKTDQAHGAATTAAAFLKEAAQGGMAEVQLSQLAAQKASRADVKSFAEKLVTDHSNANDEVKALAARKNIDLPMALDAKHKATHDKLASLSGAAFDRAYLDAMLADHRTDVAEFKRQSTMNQDPDVKAWAAKTLPTLEEHLKQVQALSKDGAKTQ